VKLEGGAGKIQSVDIFDPGPSRIRVSIDVNDAAVDLADSFFPNYALVAACLWQRGDHRGLGATWRETARRASVSLSSGSMRMGFTSNLIGMDLDIDQDGNCRLVASLACEAKHCRRAADMIHRALSVNMTVDQAGTEVDLIDLGEEGIEEVGRMSGDELRSMREKAGLTRNQLAEMVDLSAKTIQRYESGMRRIPRDLGEMVTGKLQPSPSR
jgi:DNA-binding transcriptional regulator YiaG